MLMLKLAVVERRIKICVIILSFLSQLKTLILIHNSRILVNHSLILVNHVLEGGEDSPEDED
jgi:hypothetical protein